MERPADPTLMRSEPTAFVGRQTILRRLAALYRSGRHVLLTGAPGTGKTRLMMEFIRGHPVLFAQRCHCLGEFLASLEPAAGLERDGLKLAARVHRLAARLPQIRRPIVIDDVARVPPRVAHLIRALMRRQPVWMLARSVQPIDVGHVWPFLFLCKRLDLSPFSFAETRAFLASAPFDGDRRELAASALRLHRLCAGHPATLKALVDELGARTYDLGSAEGLRLLALHARITGVTKGLSEPERLARR